MANRPPKAPPPPSLEGYHMPRPRAPQPEQMAGTQSGHLGHSGQPHAPQGQPRAPIPAPAQPPMPLSIDAGRPAAGPPQNGKPDGRRRGDTRKRPEPEPRSALASLALYLGFASLALCAFAVAYIAGSSPQTLVQDRLAAAVKAHTGRDLVIGGGTSFSFYPKLGVVMRDVILSAPPGMTGAPTARIGELDALVSLAPLLQREVEVERLIVRNAAIDLRVDKAGKRSWQFSSTDAPPPVRFAQARIGTRANDANAALPGEAKEFLKNATDKPGAGPGPVGLSLENVRIDNATVTFTDERSGQNERLTAINAVLSSRTLETPLEAKGSLLLEDEKVAFDGRLTSLKAILAEQPARLSFNAEAAPLKVTFDGTVLTRDAVDLTGAFTLASPSARGLAAWAGTTLPPSQGFGPFAVKGNLHAAGKSLTFTETSFDLDGATASGVLSVVSGGARPLIKANLRISELDLNKYAASAAATAGPAADTAPASPPASSGAAGPAAPGAGPLSIEDLLGRAPAAQGQGAPAGGARVKGYVKRAGWSEEPISTAVLGLADVEASLAIGRVQVRDIKVGQSRLKVSLMGRTLKSTIEDVTLYDGRAHGVLTVDAAGAVPKIAASLVADNLASQALLKDAADLDWLSGTGRMQLALAGQGASEKQIVDSLDGTASFGFANGAVAGWNVPQILRGLSQGRLVGFDRTPTEKTDFSELSASFAIKDGVAENQDLKLASPMLRASGAGRIMLGARQIDYTVKPKVVGSLAGQGGPLNLTGLEVPIRVKGSWDGPSYEPDIAGAVKSAPVQEIIKDPSKAVETVKEIGRKIGGEKAGKFLKDLLGGD